MESAGTANQRTCAAEVSDSIQRKAPGIILIPFMQKRRKKERAAVRLFSCYTEEAANGKADAYFTVEASLIMGIVLVIIVLVIYVSFHLYNRCLYAQDSYLLCMRESLIKDERNLVSELVSCAQGQFGKKYFGVMDRSVSAREAQRKISCSGAQESAHTLFQGSPVMPGIDWTIHFGSSARKSDPAYHIRLYRRIRFLAGEAAKAVKK